MKEIKKGTILKLDGAQITVTDIKIRAFLGHWYTHICYLHNAFSDDMDPGETTEDSMRLDDFLSQLEDHGITPDR